MWAGARQKKCSILCEIPSRTHSRALSMFCQKSLRSMASRFTRSDNYNSHTFERCKIDFPNTQIITIDCKSPKKKLLISTFSSSRFHNCFFSPLRPLLSHKLPVAVPRGENMCTRQSSIWHTAHDHLPRRAVIQSKRVDDHLESRTQKREKRLAGFCRLFHSAGDDWWWFNIYFRIFLLTISSRESSYCRKC